MSNTDPRPFIALIGYRGTGKTLVGRRLAEVIGWHFIDADAELETRAGAPIRDIFASEGESGFRDRESAILAELTGLPDTVLATGGGCVLRPENREYLRRGYVVWLTATPGTIWQRIQDDPTTAARRPNLSTGGLGEIEEMLALREPIYRELADFTIATDDLSPDMLAASILTAWTSSSDTFI